MTRINLLPPERIKEKRPKRKIPKAPPTRSMAWLIIVLPLLVAGGMGYWWFSLKGGLGAQEETLKKKEVELRDWQAKNKELEQYKVNLDEIVKLESAAVIAIQGKVYWARILNEIAIMCPSNIWLTSLAGTSESDGSGEIVFTGYAIQCPNRLMGGLYPYYPDYKPIAYWLERVAQIGEFKRVWLSNTEPYYQETASTWLIDFESKATLNPDTAEVARPGGEGQ